jgi:hypothetical protein
MPWSITLFTRLICKSSTAGEMLADMRVAEGRGETVRAHRAQSVRSRESIDRVRDEPDSQAGARAAGMIVFAELRVVKRVKLCSHS